MVPTRRDDPRTLEEGKLALVRRFGEAARTIDARRRSGERFAARPAYQQLYAIGCRERSYPVQLATAQEIGAGVMPPTWRCGRCSPRRARPARPSGPARPRTAAAAILSPGPGDDSDSWRAWITSAWLAPMLAGSLRRGGHRARAPGSGGTGPADLAQWLRHIGHDARRPGEEELPISLEIALAQGFKYAANRRSPHADDGREARMHLAEQALEMLKGSRFWFTQLTLIQALCLLNMSDVPAARPRPVWPRAGGDRPALARRGRP